MDKVQHKIVYCLNVIRIFVLGVVNFLSKQI